MEDPRLRAGPEVTSSQWGGNGRIREVQSVNVDERHIYLAAQVDEVEKAVLERLEKINKTLNRILVSVSGLLIAVLASTVTALVSGVVGK